MNGQLNNPADYATLETAPVKTGLSAATAIVVSSTIINILELSVPLAILLIYDRVIPNGTTTSLAALLTATTVAVAINLALRLARIGIIARVNAKYEDRTRDHVMQRLLSGRFPARRGVPLSRVVSGLNSGDLISNVKLLRLQSWVDLPFGILFLTLITSIGGWLALIPVALAGLFFAATLLLARSMAKVTKTFSSSNDERQHYFGEVLNNIHSAKSMAVELPLVGGFIDHQARRSTAARDRLFVNAIGRDLYGLFSNLAVAAVIVIGTLLALDGHLSLGSLAACTLLAGRALEPLQTIYRLILQQAQLGTMNETLHPIVHNEQESLTTSAAHDIWTNAPDINISQLRVKHAQSSAYVIDGLDLTLAGGEILSISGDRGCGKTLLAQSMIGMFSSDGRVEIGGIAVTPETATRIRAHTAYLSNNVEVPGGDLTSVLTLGDQTLWTHAFELSRQIGLDEVVSRLPEGYDTVVEFGDTSLPIGVRQQISIVRALVRNPRLVIFDDAVQNIDASTEIRLTNLLARLKGSTTIVLISDKLGFQNIADRKLILTQGRLAAAIMPREVK